MVEIEEDRLKEIIIEAYGDRVPDESLRERMWDNISQTSRWSRSYATSKAKSGRRIGTLGAGMAAAIAAVVGLVAVTHAGNSLSSHHKSQYARLPKPTLSKVSLAGIGFPLQPNPNSRLGFVSPDGRWLLVSDVKGHAILENMAGHLYQIPDAKPPQGMGIYGETNHGAIILALGAGGAPLEFAFSETRGIVKRFPSGDPLAKVAYFANESRKGNWAMLVAHKGGAGPGTSPWLDINGKPIPSLQESTQWFAWSPINEVLADLVQTPAGSSYQLAFYDESRKRLVASVVVPNDNIIADNPLIAANALAWSPNGKFVGVGTNHGIYVVNAKTFHTAVISPKTKIPDWNWVSGNELYVANHKRQGFTQVGFYSMNSFNTVSTVRVPGVIEQSKVIAKNKVLMQNERGQLYLVSPGRSLLTVGQHIEVWWFDSARDSLFYALKSNPAQVWQLRLAPVISAGEHS